MLRKTLFYTCAFWLAVSSAFAQDEGVSSEGQSRPRSAPAAAEEAPGEEPDGPTTPAPTSPSPEASTPAQTPAQTPAEAPAESAAPPAAAPAPKPAPAQAEQVTPAPAVIEKSEPAPARRRQEGDAVMAEDEAGAAAPETDGTLLKAIEPGQLLVNTRAGAELAPSLKGLTGVFRTVSARSGPRNSMRFGAHGGGYYVTHEWDDANQMHLEAQGHLAYSLLDELEVHIDGIGTGHRIIPNAERDDAEFLQTLGDVALGGKYMYKFYDYLSAAGMLDLRFYTKLRSMGVRWGSFSALPMGIVTFDGRQQPDLQWPIVAHANLGFFWDNSGQVLLGTGKNVDFNARLTASRLMALNVKPGSQVVFNIAFEFPQEEYTVFLEYSTEQEINNTIGNGIRKGHWNQSPQRLTPGVRWNFIDRLVLDAAFDVSYGLTGEYIAAQVAARSTNPYQFWLGLSYSYDPDARKIIDNRGYVKGIVVDAETGEPIGGAVIQYPAGNSNRQITRGDDGNFTSFPLLPGQAKIRIVKEKYEPVVISPTVLSSETITEKILLRKIDEGGQLVGALVGTVLDSAAKPVGATLTFVDQEIAGTRSNVADGSFVKILPPGQYKVRVEAEGYDTKIFLVPIEARRKTKVVFELPSIGGVSVGALAGVLMDPEGKPIGGVIHFAEGNVKDIMADGQTGEFYATLPPGRYKIEVKAEGYGARDYLIPIEAGKKTRVDIKLVGSTAMGAIAGRLLGANDQPLAGYVKFADAKVGVLPVDPSTGGFMKILPVGTYDVEIGATGFKSQAIKLQILEGKKTIQDFYLDNGEVENLLARIDGGNIALGRPISLPKDGTDLSSENREVLDAIADLVKSSSQKIIIRVYTDDEGPAKANFKITQSQADAIVEYLVTKGIVAERMNAVGGGEEKPAAPNDTPENKAKNRRAEFQVK